MPPWGSASWDAGESLEPPNTTLAALQGCGHATGGQHNSRDCRTRGEVGIVHAVHPGAWGKRQAVEGTSKRLLASQRKPDPGDSESQAQTLLQAPLRLLADPAPSSSEKLETVRLQHLYRELELTYELLQQEFTARR